MTSVGRLLDVLPIFADDPRVTVSLTIAPGSVHAAGTRELADVHGMRLLPWEKAVDEPFKLALSASANGALHRLRAPVVVLPHGAGFSKLLPGGGISGLAASQLMHHGRVIPAAIVLPHHGQLSRLREECPQAAERAVVAGDPCFDRIMASSHRRGEYRQAFGVPEGARMVVLSSTWENDSLFERQPDLAGRLLDELPYDGYRVAMIMHPNVWARYQRFQIRQWLRRAERAGLILIPPAEGWRAAITAADVFIGDYGSCALYAAGAGVPVLLAESGSGHVAPGSPADQFAGTARHLNPETGLRAQIDEAISAGPASLPAGVFAPPGRSLSVLRSLCYRLLQLPEPLHPAESRSVPVPEHACPEPTAFRVHSSVEGTLVRLDRYPPDTAGGHLAADADREPLPRYLASASVLWRTGWPAQPPHQWAAQTLATWPAARIAAIALPDSRCVLFERDGSAWLSTAAGAVADATCHPSAWLALWRNGQRPATTALHAGEAEAVLTITPWTGAASSAK